MKLPTSMSSIILQRILHIDLLQGCQAKRRRGKHLQLLKKKKKKEGGSGELERNEETSECQK